MPEASPESLRAQVARIRRIVRDLTDQRARQALLALAEEYEARAATLEHAEKATELFREIVRRAARKE
jgi:hypothetical protein